MTTITQVNEKKYIQYDTSEITRIKHDLIPLYLFMKGPGWRLPLLHEAKHILVPLQHNMALHPSNPLIYTDCRFWLQNYEDEPDTDVRYANLYSTQTNRYGYGSLTEHCDIEYLILPIREVIVTPVTNI